MISIHLDVDSLLDELATDSQQDDEAYVATELVADETRIVQVWVVACTVPGEAGQPNEDAFGIAQAGRALFAGVFDGTTSLRPIKDLENRGITGARFASHFLKEGLHLSTPETSPKDLLIALNSALLEVCVTFEGVDPRDTNTLPASSATIVKVDAGDGTVQLAHAYDSWCIAYYVDGSSELLTVDRNRPFDQEIFDLIRTIAQRESITPREARKREAVKKLMEESRVRKNNTPDGSGAGIVNGDPNLVQYIQTKTIALPTLAAVLLGTDGLLPQGWSAEDEADRQRILREIRAGGLKRLIEIKKQSEDTDPGWYHVRFKHSDDATGLFIDL